MALCDHEAKEDLESRLANARKNIANCFIEVCRSEDYDDGNYWVVCALFWIDAARHLSLRLRRA